MINKNIVLYNNKTFYYIRHNCGALVTPINHTSPLISNTKIVRTSKVLSFNKQTGIFETLNSEYHPAHPWQPNDMNSQHMYIPKTENSLP